jgi:hypothetical protein
MPVASVLVPVENRAAVAEIGPLVQAALAQPQVKELVVAGHLAEADRAELARLGARTLSVVGGRGAAIKAALGEIKGEIVILQDPDPAYRPADYPTLLAPLLDRHADAVYGVRF